MPGCCDSVAAAAPARAVGGDPRRLQDDLGRRDDAGHEAGRGGVAGRRGSLSAGSEGMNDTVRSVARTPLAATGARRRRRDRPAARPRAHEARTNGSDRPASARAARRLACRAPPRRRSASDRRRGVIVAAVDGGAPRDGRTAAARRAPAAPARASRTPASPPAPRRPAPGRRRGRTASHRPAATARRRRPARPAIDHERRDPRRRRARGGEPRLALGQPPPRLRHEEHRVVGDEAEQQHHQHGLDLARRGHVRALAAPRQHAHGDHVREPGARAA